CVGHLSILLVTRASAKNFPRLAELIQSFAPWIAKVPEPASMAPTDTPPQCRLADICELRLGISGRWFLMGPWNCTRAAVPGITKPDTVLGSYTRSGAATA